METDLRALQLKELEILKAVDAICREHGLRYMLDGGTCLGAMRHQGFIPWDDDVDIGMPRADFERFRAMADEVLPPYHLAALDSEKTKHNCRMFLKVHDTRTTYICKRDVFPDMWHGVNIDVFPYDGYPPTEEEARAMRKKLGKLKWINHARRMPLPRREDVGTARYLGMLLIKLFLPRNWALRRRSAIYQKYAPEQCEKVFCECFGQLFICERDCIERLQLQPFEDAQFPCPANYDSFLTGYYGDWRTPPPEDERGEKHPGVHISLDKSYLTRWWEQEEEKEALPV